ncbi:flavohemoglobin expression-modulating QEGLA motif protein [Olivibacter sitiensis]|uniref:flavohemoglobin expression-modulating QEGLA motif protein n=1 Tax=Olivibacter sitiensis TaxID=376470 RepID=UPI0004283CD9|nr:tyrosine/phenylalanine carboxypeptidase domain-containing protein [Olivibacter sitiensis]
MKTKQNHQKKKINQILDKLKKGDPLRISLPERGVLKIDRPLPFIIVYRIREKKDTFISNLSKTESSFLIATETAAYPLNMLIQQMAEYLADKFGSFLILEMWSAEDTLHEDFTIHLHQKAALKTAENLQSELKKIEIGNNSKLSATLETHKSPYSAPGFSSLIDDEIAKKNQIIRMGIEIAPIYINKTTGKPYPIFLRELRTAFGKALRKSLFEYVRTATTFKATHFEMLGTTIIDEKVWAIDEALAECSNLFDFLLLVTPINVADEWDTFKKNSYSKDPIFHYRPMPIEPDLIKRRLYELRIEDIADPTLSFLFRDKRKELDRMLNMMLDRDKPDFMHSSLQLFGNIDDQLLDVAQAILVVSNRPSPQEEEKAMDAKSFAVMAEQELKWLKQQDESVSTVVRIRDDIEGVMVSRGVLNINKNYKLTPQRALALLQHEVGTHVVTYYNGKAQPLKLFYIGVPGYEQLQEGLAVFAEYLVGGLSNDRMRVLAARVIAVNQLTKGYPFRDTFSLLIDKHHFTPADAFHISMRVYRGGGLTKDAVYLKGLLNLIEYIKNGYDLAPLLIGKIRQDYIPVINELTFRGLLNKIPIKPRYLSPPFNKKIKYIKEEGTIFNMLQNENN